VEQSARLANRHPVDQLADVRAEIKELEKREAALRGQLLAEGADLSGGEHYGRVVTSTRNQLDRAMLERVIGKEAVEACCKPIEVTTLRLIRRGEEA
jgi:hypothetical protein